MASEASGLVFLAFCDVLIPSAMAQNVSITLHMASIIIFSSLWGIGFKEWRSAGTRAGQLLALALFLVVASTVIAGYGNYLGLATAGQ